jgi:hypothetical protein
VEDFHIIIRGLQFWVAGISFGENDPPGPYPGGSAPLYHGEISNLLNCSALYGPKCLNYSQMTMYSTGERYIEEQGIATAEVAAVSKLNNTLCSLRQLSLTINMHQNLLNLIQHFQTLTIILIPYYMQLSHVHLSSMVVWGELDIFTLLFIPV